MVISIHMGDVGNFSFAQCIGVAQLVSGLLLDEIFLICHCRFDVSTGRGEFRSSGGF